MAQGFTGPKGAAKTAQSLPVNVASDQTVPVLLDINANALLQAILVQLQLLNANIAILKDPGQARARLE